MGMLVHAPRLVIYLLTYIPICIALHCSALDIWNGLAWVAWEYGRCLLRFISFPLSPFI